MPSVKHSFFFLFGATATSGPGPPHSRGFQTTLNDNHSRQDSSGRVISPLQRPLPDNTLHSKRQTYMPPVGFEPTIPEGERPQAYALDRTATGTGETRLYSHYFKHATRTKLKVCMIPSLCIQPTLELTQDIRLSQLSELSNIYNVNTLAYLVQLPTCQPRCSAQSLAVTSYVRQHQQSEHNHERSRQRAW